MDFLNKVKDKLNMDKVPVEKVKELVGKPANDVKEPEVEEENKELLEILDSVHIDYNSLALERVESEIDTVSNYVRGLIKDLSAHHDLEDGHEDKEKAIKAIGSKIKLIHSHGLELKNLLVILEDHYYKPLIKALRDLFDLDGKGDVEDIAIGLENDLYLLKELTVQLTKVIGYNDIFNLDKNSEHRKALEKEAEEKVVHGDLNKLLDSFLVVVDKSKGLKNKIEKDRPLEKARELL